MRESDLEVIEDYPMYDPAARDYRPSTLIRGEAGGRVFHTVVTYPPGPIVITFYWPDTQPGEWTSDFRRRLRR